MMIDGITLYPVNIWNLEDRDPVYIKFNDETIFKSQWGIVDKSHSATIHKDFTISFSDKCSYFSMKDFANKKTDRKAGKISYLY